MNEQNTSLAPSEGAKKPDRSGRLLRALIVCTAVLTVALTALLIVRWRQGKLAGDAAQAVLQAYEEKATAQPAKTSPSASPAAPMVTPEAATDPNGPRGPEVTPSPSEEAALAREREHMLEDDYTGEDLAGAYDQPDAPEIDAYDEANKAALKKLGREGVIGVVEIPDISVKLPVLSKWSYSLLKVSVCRFQGPGANETGNLVIIGHNYKNGSHFGKLDQLTVGSKVLLTGSDGTEKTYHVYEIETVGPDELSALEPYRGDAGLTLVTCTSHGSLRRVVRCEQQAEA